MISTKNLMLVESYLGGKSLVKKYITSKLQDYRYKGKVTRVIDADTVDAKIDLGFGLTFQQRFRISSFDAPETWRPRNQAEEEHGKKATKRALELLLEKKLIFVTSKIPGIYGRYAAQIFLEDGQDYAQLMIKEGYQKKDSY